MERSDEISSSEDEFDLELLNEEITTIHRELDGRDNTSSGDDSDEVRGEQWTMVRGNKYGDIIGFRNTTRVGKHESLAWRWTELDGGRWSTRLWTSLQQVGVLRFSTCSAAFWVNSCRNIMARSSAKAAIWTPFITRERISEVYKSFGGLRYTRLGRYSTTVAALSWKLNKDGLAWISGGDPLHPGIAVTPWKLSLCARKIQWQVIPETNGTWIFKLGKLNWLLHCNLADNKLDYLSDIQCEGNVTIQGGEDGSLQSDFTTWVDDTEDMDRQNRSKRSAEEVDYPFLEEDAPSGKLTIPFVGNGTRTVIRSIMEAIMEFFFGGADSRSNEGLISRIARWIERIACRLTSSCTNQGGAQPPVRNSTNPNSESQVEMLPNYNRL
ncbi:hypothetical protein AAG570_003863 [Ranatra chinensis]|uniref:Uncharacterized protein n=1 Tax=Ranatra chinensis TaxID=642074 RepID=A0ABD0Y2G0_9HEMI